MRLTTSLLPAAAFVLVCGPGARPGSAQDPPAKPPPDEFRALIKAVEQAYKAPMEVEKDVLDELRRQYRDPSAEREAKILRDVRRVYATSPAQEEAIVRELHRAYRAPSPEQEARVLEEIRRGGQLPPGTLSPEAQTERAAKMFRKLDRNGDGVLNSDEMPEFLRSQLRNWDRNRDGAIDGAEYLAYFQANLKWVAAGVASGEIPLKLPKPAAPEPPPAEMPAKRHAADAPKPTAGQASQPPPKLPDWFGRLDEDGDGQVGLYEWRKAGRPIAEFLEMDLNHDGFLEAKELLAFLAEHPPGDAGNGKRR